MSGDSSKRKPERKCIGCGDMKKKDELMRIVLKENAEAVADDTGKLPGRGAYICPEKACVENARKRKALERSFKTRIDPVSYERLKEAVERFGTG